MISISTVDPRARIIDGVELGPLRPFMRGDSRRPWACLVVAKSRGGTGRLRTEVRP